MIKRKNNENSLDLGEIYMDKVELVKNILGSGDSVLVMGESFMLENLNAIFGDLLKVSLSDIMSKNNMYRNLNKLVRRSKVVKVVDTFKIVEGQVTVMNEQMIQLKTNEMESKFEIGNKLWEELQRECVTVGDVIKLYKEYGVIKKMGRAISVNNNEQKEFIDLPNGECFKVEKNETELTMDEIDLINFGENGSDLIHSTVFVDKNIQKEVDAKLSRWVKEDKATIENRGILIEGTGEENLKLLNDIFEYFSYLKVPVIFTSKKTDLFLENFIAIDFGNLENSKIQEVLETKIKNSNYEIETTNFDRIYSIALNRGLDYALSLIDFCYGENRKGLSKLSDYFELFVQSE